MKTKYELNIIVGVEVSGVMAPLVWVKKLIQLNGSIIYCFALAL